MKPWAAGCAGLLLILETGPVPGAEIRVYRCLSADGQVAFRQQPCPSGKQTEIQVREVMSGWDAPVVPLPDRTPRKASRNEKGKATKQERKDAQAQKCFKARQRVEALSRRLRRGYKAGQGDRLRFQRHQQEEYLSRFCD